MGDFAIRAQGLGKLYRTGQYTGYNLRESLTNAFTAPINRLRRRRAAAPAEDNYVWALKDVSFEVKQGEAVGIIGRNGAGKTTLLRVLTRIAEPTEGEAEIRGRVGSLLEVGTGFHAELTGRENVYLNGAVLGMKRKEIDKKFDEIVAFSEVDKFIDTPVKRFSSGMQMRLAFAVAAHLEPEVLLVDEVLAVGDAAFQKKCLGRMDEVTGQGRTVLLVSHNMNAIMGLCSRAIWIDAGRVKADGPVEQVVKDYLSASSGNGDIQIADSSGRTGNGRVRFTDFHLCDQSGVRVSAAISGEPIDFVLSYVTAKEPAQNVSAFVNMEDAFGRILLNYWTHATGEGFAMLPPDGQIICHIPRLPLREGKYKVNLGVDVGHGNKADRITEGIVMEVVPGNFFGTGNTIFGTDVFCDHSWRLGQAHD